MTGQSTGPMGIFLSELGEDPLASEPPERDALLTRPGPYGHLPFMPAGEVAVLAGDPGAGKTHFACALGLAVATGQPLFGTFHVPRSGAVAMFFAEERLDEVRRRLHAASQAAGLDRDARRLAAQRIMVFGMAGQDTAFVAKDASQNLQDGPALLGLRSRLEGAGVDFRLVIIDPFINVTAGEENDNTAQRRAMTACASLANVPGSPAVCVVHHTRKSDGGGRGDGVVGMHEVRGAGSIVGAARFVLTLGVVRTPTQSGASRDNGVRLQCVKSNYFAHGPPIFLARTRGGALRPMTPAELAAAGVAQAHRGDGSEVTS